MRLSVSLSLLAAALLAWVEPSAARNVAIVHPVGPVMRSKAGRDLVSDLRVSFGSASSQGLVVVRQNVEVEGLGSAEYVGNRRPSDAEVCDRALMDALSKLVLAARKAGANGIAGIVSNYQHQPFDDPANVECHAGTFKSHVVLQADFVRVEGKPPASAQFLPTEHARAVPAASGFADINDVLAVPISAQGQARYQHYLTLPAPKAFTINADGGWRFYWQDPEAMSKALDYCARQGKVCWLYAVDDRVVWTADPAGRIQNSRQLIPR
jgi:uncharacterized protein YbjQ (UPF0145 family)